jgi:methyl-accepting chemotaxis protein
MSRILRFGDWPVAAKLGVTMVLIAVIPLGAMAAVNYTNTSTSLRGQVGESLAAVASSAAVQTSRILSSNIDLLMTEATEFETALMIEGYNAGYTGTDEEILNQIMDLDQRWAAAADTSMLVHTVISDVETVNPLSASLHTLVEHFPQHVNAMYTDAYGAVIASAVRTTDYYQGDQEWWQAAWNNGEGGIYVGEPQYDASAGFMAVTLAIPVRAADGRAVGVLQSTLDVEALQTSLEEGRIGETGRAILVSRSGTVIVDNVPLHLGEAVDSLLPSGALSQAPRWAEVADPAECYACHVEVSAPLIAGYGSLQGAPGASYAEVNDLGWTVLYTIASKEAMAPVAKSTSLVLYSVFAAAGLAVVAAVLTSRLLSRPIRNIMDLLSRIGMGEFTARAKVTSSDELGTMASSLNAMLDNTLALVQTREERDAMQEAVVKLLDEVSGVAQGDLTTKAEVTTDITGAIADAFNMMITQLRDIIRRVQETTARVSSSANEIRSTAEFLSQGSEAQAVQISEMTAAVEDMAASIQQVSENASVSAKVGERARTSAEQGVAAVQNTIQGMSHIRDQVQETSKRIKRLGESSQEIGEIVQLIGDIADRTSILALNASIQAAMAGDAGKGFAVVADEVERLAERATASTKQIESLIRTIQSETSEAVSAMEVTTDEVVRGSALAEEAGRALSEIGAVSGELSELIQSISLASKQQARGSDEVARSMGVASDVTQQTAAGTKQAALAISQLAALADDLRESVSTFRLPSGNGSKAE